jgi:hypothetical protein
VLRKIAFDAFRLRVVELRFFEVGGNPNIIERHDGHELLPGHAEKVAQLLPWRTLNQILALPRITSDAEWRKIEPLLPRGRRGAHRQFSDHMRSRLL